MSILSFVKYSSQSFACFYSLLLFLYFPSIFIPKQKATAEKIAPHQHFYTTFYSCSYISIGCFIQIICSNDNTTCHLIHVGQTQVLFNKDSKLEGTAPRGRLNITTMAFLSCCTKIYILLYTKWTYEFFFEMSECIFMSHQYTKKNFWFQLLSQP